MQLGPNETKVVRFTPERFPQLELAGPRLWWPAQVGPQNLYPLDLQFQVGGEVSDSSHIRFGVRQVTSEIDDKGHRLYRINGQNILIRGAGYSMDLLLRSSPERQEAELNYVRDLNLNAIRLEGKLEDDHFLELCDQLGILVMAGWCCCDQWENWGDWDTEDELVAGESLRDQIRRLERHPSVFTWLNGSDFPPPPKVEEMYLRILKDCDWPNPSVSSASGKSTTVGQSGMKMTGPYEYVAPSFWYLDTQRGGAHGFNTETSPGPAIPPIESLRLMLPEDHLWPVDSVWEYHAGGMSDTLSVFTEALDKRYGASTSVEEYSRKAQIQAYEGHRAMTEAYGRNKYTSTGVIQWMLNNAWPSMIWHLYDWYGGCESRQQHPRVHPAGDGRSQLHLFREPEARIRRGAGEPELLLAFLASGNDRLGAVGPGRERSIPDLDMDPHEDVCRLHGPEHSAPGRSGRDGAVGTRRDRELHHGDLAQSQPDARLRNPAEGQPHDEWARRPAHPQGRRSAASVVAGQLFPTAAGRESAGHCNLQDERSRRILAGRGGGGLERKGKPGPAVRGSESKPPLDANGS